MVIIKEDGKWILYSKNKKKKLGEFDSYEKALKRERQIQYFKHLTKVKQHERGR